MKYIERVISILIIVLFFTTGKGPLEAELKNKNKGQNKVEISAIQNENFQENKDLNPNKETKLNETKKEQSDNKNEQNSDGNHFSILILEAIGNVLISVCYTLDRIIRVADKTQELLRVYLIFFPPSENNENEVSYN